MFQFVCTCPNGFRYSMVQWHNKSKPSPGRPHNRIPCDCCRKLILHCIYYITLSLSLIFLYEIIWLYFPVMYPQERMHVYTCIYIYIYLSYIYIYHMYIYIYASSSIFHVFIYVPSISIHVVELCVSSLPLGSPCPASWLDAPSWRKHELQGDGIQDRACGHHTQNVIIYLHMQCIMYIYIYNVYVYMCIYMYICTYCRYTCIYMYIYIHWRYIYIYVYINIYKGKLQ